jgi:uncharacterized repeat protein (TIGR04076 family)
MDAIIDKKEGTAMHEVKDVKITVVKVEHNHDLIEQYGAKDLGVCEKHKVGDTFISKRAHMPEGLCSEAWTAFNKYVFALAHGADGFWDNWIAERGIAVNSCNDGLRPVIFKLEVLD